MKNLPIIIGAVVLVLGAGYLVTRTNTESSQPDTISRTSSDQARNTEEALVTTNDNKAEPVPPSAANSTITEEATAPDTPGRYLAYDADAIATSEAEHILLFFKASWCPSCRALDADISKNASAIPAGVEIYSVDFDTATDLKRQYGVTTQHSIIEITADGAAQSSISHGLTLDDVLATLK